MPARQDWKAHHARSAGRDKRCYQARPPERGAFKPKSKVTLITRYSTTAGVQCDDPGVGDRLGGRTGAVGRGLLIPARI